MMRVGIEYPSHAYEQQAPVNQAPKVPTPTLERLATYFRYLCDLEASNVDTISSTEVEKQTGVNAAQFRKDLSYFGEFGKPGVGYNVVELQSRIAQILKIDRDQQVVVLGAGNLGTALLGYHGLREHRFNIVGVFDSSPAKIGVEISGLTIHHIDELIDRNHLLRARIAIVAVPSQAAQTVSDIAIKSGVRALLNFAPIILQVPDHVVVRNVSFMQELAVLSHHLSVDGVK
jgi:redox-sensing transcriptional repressor